MAFSSRPGPDPAERDRLLGAVYHEIHAIAAREMSRERAGHTLQPTALAHEAYLRLQASEALSNLPRLELLALATTVIRNVLIDHARRRGSRRRGGGDAGTTHDRHSLELGSVEIEGRVADVLEVDAAIIRLSVLDARKATVVQLRFFGGMTNEEIAAHLGVTARTVTNDWTFARAWLRRELVDVSA